MRTRIVSVDNIDDFFAAEAEAREAANSRVKPWQEALKAGDHFIRLVDAGGGAVAVIYGKIEDVKYEEDKELYAMPHMAHYRPTRCYSVLCPEGEYGDIHVSSVDHRLSPSQFALAKEMEWPSDERLRGILRMV